MIKAIDCMEAAIKTFKARNQQYGDSYSRHGHIMGNLFEGIELSTIDDFNRFGVLNMIVSKLVRYCQHFNSPHVDSVHDLGVYAFILEELDRNFLEKLDKELGVK